jgi:TrmH family RNA methyltransferase
MASGATPISSLANPQVKALVRLRERRERDGTGRFLVEGYRELARAVEAGLALETVYACPALFLGGNEPRLLSAAAAPVVELGEAAFRKVSYRDRPEGLLAVARQFPTGLDRLDLSGAPLLLVVEAIEKPGNLGTMLRAADAAGATGVVVCDPTTDPFNPNVVRASLGTLFTVPLAMATSTDTIHHLRAHSVAAVATTPHTSMTLWEADLTGPCAVVIGTEQYGLSDAWLRAARDRVRIPMAGSADSLNAATAAGIALFEAVRQRRSRPRG